MGIEGCLTIDLGAAAHAGRVTIASSRPLNLTRVFVGRSARETVRCLPTLFNVCGLAQGAAAAQACEQALGIEAPAGTAAIRELLVLVETLREHLIRALTDWPRFAGLVTRKDETLRVLRLCEDVRKAVDRDRASLGIGGSARPDETRLCAALDALAGTIECLVIGEPIKIWNQRTSADDLEAWARVGTTPAQELVRLVLDRGWSDVGRAETHFLPPLAEADLIERLLGPEAEGFVAAPTWDGVPHETTALSRQAATPLIAGLLRSHGSGLLTRIAARLVEIANAPGAMRELARDGGDQAPKPNRSGRGIAQVEAARGRLVHGVEIEDETVRRYAILAPTEWNFHARGSAARGLADIAHRTEETQKIAELFITAIDPCVGYELRIY